MLEKIGLPPKPSMRGNTWVVDASHCQGCSSQFTFINRKHHCRRCGGIFCNSCTQQRMLLRGQGDSPVRICDPCKSLEEAARFERYGHKNRAVRGSSRLASKKEDDIFNQILGDEDKVSSFQITSSASSSNNTEVVARVEGGDLYRNLSLDQPTNMLTEEESSSPEELREQATLEKKKYSTLKAEGKREEALKAYKRGKELERQAAALEITLKTNRKRPSPFSNPGDVKTAPGKNILSGQKSKGKDDLFAELKELGWSDMDVHDSEKKTASLSVEGELASLLREIAPKPDKEKKVITTDKAHVIALKKRALELKRSGNLIEAKEELKRAKILERKIEEEELLGGDDDSDDELSALIRSMDGDEHDDFTATGSDLNFSFDHFVDNGDDLAMDGNFEVTEDDMDDPEMVSALKSLGWTEDPTLSEDYTELAAPSQSEQLLTEIRYLKREALSQKRAGNTAEAMTLLRKAKLLEAELESSEHGSDLIDLGSAVDQKGQIPQAAEEPKPAPKTKLVIQRELLALKKKALSLRREGKIDESEEELRKAKVLEQQLEDMNKAPAVAEPNIVTRQAVSDTRTSHADENEDEVTDQDMHDPSYLSLLKNLGWEEEDNVKIASSMPQENLNGNSKHTSVSSIIGPPSNVRTVTSRKSKSEITRELLALKRKALTLRRQGEGEEADEVLNMAKSLEVQLQEYEEPIQIEVPTIHNKEPEISARDSLKEDKVRIERHEDIVPDSLKPSVSQSSSEPHIHESSTSEPSVSQPSPGSLKQEILVHKRKAISLKREGKLAEAKEELRQAKLLEKRVEVGTSETSLNSSVAPVPSDVPPVNKTDTSPISDSKPLSSRDRFKIQQESLGHKRQALKLRREGKTAEADAEFELAKALEAQLQELDSQDSKTAEQVEETPETSLNSSDASAGSDVPSVDKTNASPSSVSKPLSSRDRFKIQQKSLGHKRQALKLRREGKTAEADAEFELAKALESQLQELDSQDPKTSEQADDVTVEDFLDPQLLSALQSIGLEDVRKKTLGTQTPEPSKTVAENVDNGDMEREQLVERIKAEKVKAVTLRRSGKQAEALDALRRAKLYEKKLHH